MKYTYEEVINFDETVTIIATGDDGSVLFIPNNESNSDYQAYLRWLNGEDEAQSL